MISRKPQSLRRLLLVHETAFLALVIVTGAFWGVWAYFWQQSSAESVRINALLHQAQQLRGDLYRQIKEVTRARVMDDPTALEQYWRHLYHIDRGFNQLQQRLGSAQEQQAVQAMRQAYELMQTEMNKRFAEPLGGAARHIDMLDPAYEQWMLGDFESALRVFAELIGERQRGLEANLTYWTRLTPLLIPLPILLAIALLIFSRHSLRQGFVKPMKEVARGAERMSRGELDLQVPERGTEEVVLVARSLNEMARDLATSRNALVASERQAALGALVPVVAHNIRNPLASIRAAAQVADLDDPGERREATEAIIQTVDRLERWVKSLLYYLHPLEPHRTRTDLATVVDDALTLLAPRLEQKRIRVERHQWDRGLEMSADVDLLEQALYGVLNNAVEASPPDTAIAVTLECGNGARSVTIEDQGPGIPADVTPADVLPGPSTKRFGTGLGIPFAFKVLQAHGGQVAFERAPAGGTRVRLSLPATLQAAAS